MILPGFPLMVGGADSLAIGAFMSGGYYVGQIADGGAIYNLIMSPKASGESGFLNWSPADTLTGANSYTNGPANQTAILATAGTTYPAVSFCAGLSINGFADWYMPSKDEAEVIKANLTLHPEGQFWSEWPWAQIYWTSTEVNLTTVEEVYFSPGGAAGNQDKQNSRRVRAIRRVAL